MSTLTTTYNLSKPAAGDTDWTTEINDNWDTIDGALAALIKKDGTRALTADWDAGGYEIRALTFESDVVTGTAPFTVASTTVSTNLNADLLDGSHLAALLKADGTVALTADWDAGGYEIRARTLEADVITGTAPLTITSTTVVTNLNADLLDGNEAAAFAVTAKGVTNGDTHDHVGGDGAQVDHGGLGGLADDDHSQYLRVDGTRVLTADWDAGSFEVRAQTLESDVVTGTAPLTVASTTVVANLNADKVDGIEGTALKLVYIHICLDGGGSAITTGAKYAAAVRVPAGTIVDATAVANPSGSIVVDLWKDTYTNWPPTDADSITSAAPVTITTATKSQDTTLTGWTTTLTDGDWIVPNVDSATTITACVITLKVNKT